MSSALLDRLLATSSLLQRDMQRAFVGTSLSEPRIHLLWVLQQVGPSTQQTLAEKLEVTARSVSALVDGLTAGGYVVRRPHPDDGRAVLVTLTPLAAGMMARMQEDHTALEAALIDAVEPADRPAFERGLDAVLARLGELLAAEAPSYAEVEARRGR